ncbi:MAG TPA: membrane protein insertase YidC [Candidatus Acidoferrales bacterium]|nr:membrane protein insertase YidC [Candidatus Acidoferrales bacterium]
MDKTGIIVISICVLLLGVWLVEENKIARQQALFEQTNQVAQAQRLLAATNSPSVASYTPPALATVTTPAPFETNVPEQTIVLANAKARYTFTSRGGGLKLVQLLDYPQTISARWQTKDGARTNGVASLNTLALVPSFAVLGDPSLVGDGNFTLTRTADGVRAEKLLANGLREIKEFRLGSNYLVYATIRFTNTTGKPLALPAEELVVGTATPMDPDDSGQAEGVMWSDGSKASSQPLGVFLGGGCSRGGPKKEVVGGNGNVAWAAAYNQFFALMAIPQERASEMIARPVTLPQFPNVDETNMALPHGIQTALVYPAQTLSANSSLDQQVALFAGPKEYRTLAEIGAQFQNRADDVMGFGSIYGFCAKPLLLAMNWLHDVTTLGYGWVIVLLTILLRAIFWPLTAASTRSMKRMQALAPEMAALKEKYKDDQAKFAQKQMELWKKHGVNPMSGCWPMLIQMPVFFGFFTMIRSAIELRGAHFLWATDLSKPDTLFMIPGITFIPVISTPEGLPFNLLPLLMGAAMLWQSHLTPPSPGMDPAQQKMMRYMPLIFLVFLYNYSAGMSLYMVVSTLASVLQTKLTKNLRDPAAPAAPAGPRVNPALTPASKSKK